MKGIYMRLLLMDIIRWLGVSGKMTWGRFFCVSLFFFSFLRDGKMTKNDEG